MAQPKQKQAGKDLVITRMFDAPRELVWDAWTEPKYARLWWGPRVFTAPVAKIDLREGGKYLLCMRSPDGRDYWSTGVYREIVKPERLVMTDSFADAEGNVVPASYYGMIGEWPMELLVTVTLEEKAGKTKFTLRHTGMPQGENQKMAGMGWNESFDKLEQVLELLQKGVATRLLAEPGKQEILVTHLFNAPRELVFQVYTDQDLVDRWWGPSILSTTVDRMEVKPGGTWRFVQRDPDGKEYAFHGVYHDITAPERIISTFEFEEVPGHVLLETALFEEVDGITRVTDRSVFQSLEDRDGMLSANMEAGVRESGERFARLLAELRR